MNPKTILVLLSIVLAGLSVILLGAAHLVP